MTNGTSQGLFVVVAIVIFGIFVGLSYTLFGSEGLTNDLKGIFESGTEQANASFKSENLLSKDYMYTYWTNKTLFEKDTIKNTDSATYYTDGVYFSGLGIMARETLEPNKNYALKFKVTEDSGEINAIGGHLDFSTESKVYLNGELLDNSKYKANDPFQVGFYVTEKVNEVVVYFNTNDYEKDYYMTYQDKLPSSNPIHIQPNRKYIYNEDGTTKSLGFGKEYTATISNLKLWEVK